jgi:hypothetical protein
MGMCVYRDGDGALVRLLLSIYHMGHGAAWRFFIISPLLGGLAFGIFIDGWLVGWLGLRLE